MAETEVEAEEAEEAEAEHGRDAFTSDGAEDEDAALERLLETTNSKLRGVETTRKQNAFAQLKAAVAATWAERQLGGTGKAANDADGATDAYRADLAEATAPAHAAAPQGEDEQPRAENASPLVLVSEQRIDKDDEADEADKDDAVAAPSAAAPRRHRVTTEILVLEDEAETEDALADSDSFQEFAERIGAGSLPELLEAAAAYTSHVEGRQRFSRAQVMSKIARLKAGEEFSREAGLRSFGKLLREGRIRRVQDGQFVITEDSRFVQEARTGTR
ncbi:hypothetical protein DDZ14_12570 [Maritimibacter sp. 55A14]|nr:hypothetical protein DDZ14_12570 [Maritimibacter sp. 55A14]